MYTTTMEQEGLCRTSCSYLGPDLTFFGSLRDPPLYLQIRHVLVTVPPALPQSRPANEHWGVPTYDDDSIS